MEKTMLKTCFALLLLSLSMTEKCNNGDNFPDEKFSDQHRRVARQIADITKMGDEWAERGKKYNETRRPFLGALNPEDKRILNEYIEEAVYFWGKLPEVVSGLDKLRVDKRLTKKQKAIVTNIIKSTKKMENSWTTAKREWTPLVQFANDTLCRFPGDMRQHIISPAAYIELRLFYEEEISRIEGRRMISFADSKKAQTRCKRTLELLDNQDREIQSTITNVQNVDVSIQYLEATIHRTDELIRNINGLQKYHAQVLDEEAKMRQLRLCKFHPGYCPPVIKPQ
jgi:hypothetical protein